MKPVKNDWRYLLECKSIKEDVIPNDDKVFRHVDYSSSIQVDLGEFHIAHRLLNYAGPCNFLHGHAYRVTVELTGVLNSQGMIVDFADIKNMLLRTMNLYDHKTVLYEVDPLAAVKELRKHVVKIDSNPTVENLAIIWFTAMEHTLAKYYGDSNDAVRIIKLTAHETERNAAIVRATYTYS